jgi:hypothetical protein
MAFWILLFGHRHFHGVSFFFDDVVGLGSLSSEHSFMTVCIPGRRIRYLA